MMQVAVPVLNTLGECPRWHAESKSLYWLDIAEHQLYRYFPASDHIAIFELAERVSAFAFREGGGFIFTTQSGFVLADERGRIGDSIAKINMSEDFRFNDGVVDPAGRFWSGTVNNEHRAENVLYQLNFDGSVSAMEKGIVASNGIGWSADGRVMYFVDSRARTIYAYDFDVNTGEMSNRRVFVTTPDDPAVPDGLAVDAEGCVWCAYWDGWRVVRYGPTGETLQIVEMPVARPTALAFAGTDLYITSARMGLSAEDLHNQPLAGNVFLYPTSTSGLETTFARL